MPRRFRSCSTGSDETVEGSMSAAVRMGMNDPINTAFDRACKKYYTSFQLMASSEFRCICADPVGRLMFAGIERR